MFVPHFPKSYPFNKCLRTFFFFLFYVSNGKILIIQGQELHSIWTSLVKHWSALRRAHICFYGFVPHRFQIIGSTENGKYPWNLMVYYRADTHIKWNWCWCRVREKLHKYGVMGETLQLWGHLRWECNF